MLQEELWSTSRCAWVVSPYTALFGRTWFLSSRSPAQSRQSARLFFQSSALGLLPPPPLTRRRVCTSPPLVQGGGSHLLAGGGWGGGGPYSDEGTDTVVLYRYMCTLWSPASSPWLHNWTETMYSICTNRNHGLRIRIQDFKNNLVRIPILRFRLPHFAKLQYMCNAIFCIIFMSIKPGLRVHSYYVRNYASESVLLSCELAIHSHQTVYAIKPSNPAFAFHKQ